MNEEETRAYWQVQVANHTKLLEGMK
jgi:hypothetical protein